MPSPEPQSELPTISQALRLGQQSLAAEPSAQLETELLLAHVLGITRSGLYSHSERRLTVDELAQFNALVKRRGEAVPIAYLIGRGEFWSLELSLNADVLIPRPETELLVELALALLPPDRACTVVDLGTGSGAVAAAIASERNNAKVVATDRSLAAIKLARANFIRLGLERVAAIAADWAAPLAPASFDMVISNPPYIGDHERASLEPDLSYEPSEALFAADDGLGDLAQLINQAPRILRGGGHLLLEHGYQQGPAVRELLAKNHWTAIRTARDLSAHERVTAAQWRAAS